MSGAAVSPAQTTGLGSNSAVGGIGGAVGTSSLSASELNSFRISAVVDRLNIHLQSFNSNPLEFFNLCLSLSRGIDFAIANHEISNRCHEFPSLMKQVCQYKNDPHLLSGIMVLMISVKSACQNGWFSDGDSEELGNLAKEISSYFGSVPDIDAEPSCSHSVISTIMSRFYPKMKMGHVFVFLEVKTGFDAYVSDFQISKSLKCSPGDKIRLFVVRTDNIETSSCLVTPAKVNFLLNGKGVDRRNNLLMETGPQLPTVVTPVLKYGSNLLQAVGDFTGNYIIAVAFMSELPNPGIDCLQDYEQHTPANVDADTDLIEGPSRVSLNCPISFSRIKTPVKGLSCKHIQCFDFDNYVDINSRKPFWRCPTCNQNVCFSDIRVDQKMVKVLNEVEPNVSNIIISSDGSWKAVSGSDDNVHNKPIDKTSNGTGLDDSSPEPFDVMDLTQLDDTMDAMDIVPTYETEDRKFNPHTNQIENDDWAGIYMSTLGSSNVQSTEPQSGPDTMQLQQYQFGNPSVSNEYGRFPMIPGHITRTPTAVQALPAMTPTSVLQRNSTNRLGTNGLQVPPSAPNVMRSFTDTRQVSPMSSPTLRQHSSTQQNSQYASTRSPHQNASFPDSNMYGHDNSTQQMSNLRGPRATSPSPRTIQQQPTPSTGSFLRPSQHSHILAAANRAVQQMSVDASRTVPTYPGRNNPTPPAGDQRGTSPGNNYNPADPGSWRTPARMRGALSGQAYNNYYNQFITQPSQQAQVARPIPDLANVRPPLQALVAGGIIEETPPPNYGNGSSGMP